jgi:hypothetical protein
MNRRSGVTTGPGGKLTGGKKAGAAGKESEKGFREIVQNLQIGVVVHGLAACRT